LDSDEAQMTQERTDWRRRRVLILADQPLFAQAVRSLVESNSRMSIVGVEPPGQDTLERVRSLRPDVIIFESEGEQSPLLPVLLDNQPKVRLIQLTLAENVIRVYDRRQITARRAQDLMDILECMSSPVSAAFGPNAAPEKPES
jgi:chemotaxis response regulator CheB